MLVDPLEILLSLNIKQVKPPPPVELSPATANRMCKKFAPGFYFMRFFDSKVNRTREILAKDCFLFHNDTRRDELHVIYIRIRREKPILHYGVLQYSVMISYREIHLRNEAAYFEAMMDYEAIAQLKKRLMNSQSKSTKKLSPVKAKTPPSMKTSPMKTQNNNMATQTESPLPKSLSKSISKKEAVAALTNAIAHSDEVDYKEELAKCKSQLEECSQKETIPAKGKKTPEKENTGPTLQEIMANVKARGNPFANQQKVALKKPPKVEKPREGENIPLIIELEIRNFISYFKGNEKEELMSLIEEIQTLRHSNDPDLEEKVKEFENRLDNQLSAYKNNTGQKALKLTVNEIVANWSRKKNTSTRRNTPIVVKPLSKFPKLVDIPVYLPYGGNKQVVEKYQFTRVSNTENKYKKTIGTKLEGKGTVEDPEFQFKPENIEPDTFYQYNKLAHEDALKMAMGANVTNINNLYRKVFTDFTDRITYPTTETVQNYKYFQYAPNQNIYIRSEIAPNQKAYQVTTKTAEKNVDGSFIFFKRTPENTYIPSVQGGKKTRRRVNKKYM
jgi:hypothetical protein